MNATEQLLLAGYIRGQIKRAGAWDMTKRIGLGAADFGSYAIPGVGTARLGYDAFNAFRQGNILGGVGNTLGAGISLIPGGGWVGRGLGWGGRMLGRGLGRIGAPTLGAAARVSGRAAKTGLDAVNTTLGKVPGMIGSRAQSVAQKMPTFGGNRVASGIGTVSRLAGKNPGLTQLGGTGASLGLVTAGTGAQEARLMASQQQAGAQDLMQNWRSRMPMGNPMMTGGGQNMNYRFA